MLVGRGKPHHEGRGSATKLKQVGKPKDFHLASRLYFKDVERKYKEDADQEEGKIRCQGRILLLAFEQVDRYQLFCFL